MVCLVCGSRCHLDIIQADSVFRSVVQVIILTTIAEALTVAILTSSSICRIWEAEEAAWASVLHRLSEGLISSDFHISDRATSLTHGNLEVSLRQLSNWIFGIGILVHGVFASSLTLLGALDVESDRLLDGKLGRTLGDEAEIGTREAVSGLGDVLEINIWSNWGLSELSLEDTGTGSLVWQWDVDKSVETAGAAQSIVELLWTIGGTDDEHVLLGGHAVHF